MNKLFQLLAAVMLVAVAVNNAVAQDWRNDSKDKRSVKIEMRDGKVWVNGDELPEGTDLKEYLKENGYDDLDVSMDGRFRITDDDGNWSVRIDRDGDGPHGMRFGNVFFDRDDDDNNGFAFRFGDKDNVFFRSPNHAFDLDALNDIDVNLEGLSHLGPNVFGYMTSSPELMKKERESRDLARRVRNAEGSERAELERELDTLLADIFAEKMDLRRERAEKLRERLAEQDAAINERQRNRDDIIARRKAELLGEKDRFDW